MSEFDRYHRQMLLAGFGEEGQRRLAASHAVVVGCGALGTVIIDALARAGVGRLTVIDRDIVELTNLQRQVLFDESDVRDGTPKAIAAQRAITRINSSVEINAHVDDFNAGNAVRLIGDADVIVDGLDNFETRYLLNDIAVRDGRPYVYGGAVGTTGMSLVVIPTGTANADEHDVTPCLRCVFPEAPPPGTTPTCDTAGVLGPVVMMIAAHQATQTLKILSGNVAAVDRSLLSIDVWANETRRFDVGAARNAECRCCGERSFEFLDGVGASRTTSLCGRNAVQIMPAQNGEQRMNLDELRDRLAAHGDFIANDMVLRGTLRAETGDQGEAVELMVFANGRAIVRGTARTEAARSIYAKYIGA